MGTLPRSQGFRGIEVTLRLMKRSGVVSFSQPRLSQNSQIKAEIFSGQAPPSATPSSWPSVYHCLWVRRGEATLPGSFPYCSPPSPLEEGPRLQRDTTDLAHVPHCCPVRLFLARSRDGQSPSLHPAITLGPQGTTGRVWRERGLLFIHSSASGIVPGARRWGWWTGSNA